MMMCVPTKLCTNGAISFDGQASNMSTLPQKSFSWFVMGIPNTHFGIARVSILIPNTPQNGMNWVFYGYVLGIPWVSFGASLTYLHPCTFDMV